MGGEAHGQQACAQERAAALRASTGTGSRNWPSALQAGVPVDPRDEDGRTPLYMACGSGHSEVAAALMAAGADCLVANDCGQVRAAARSLLLCPRAH